MIINGKLFDVDTTKDVLTTVLEQGYTVNHSCRDGKCGQCVINVKNKNQTNNYHACQYFPKHDDVIEFEYFESFKLPDPVISPAKINAINVKNDKFITVALRFPPGKFQEILPGQYVKVIIPGIGFRSYSIYSMDLENNTFTLLIGKINGGAASDFFFNQASKGTLLTIKGPFGSFRFRPEPDSTHIFCATGSGIAPINAILESNQVKEMLTNGAKMHVIWGNSKVSDFFKLEYISKVTLNAHRFASKDGNSNISLGRITNPTIDLLGSHDENETVNVYSCGNPNFIDDLKFKIENLNRNNVNYYTDYFTCNGKEK